MMAIMINKDVIMIFWKKLVLWHLVWGMVILILLHVLKKKVYIHDVILWATDGYKEWNFGLKRMLLWYVTIL